jgi:NTP pyrophosphatase (non-canonical NTP hydrolase)
MKTLINQLANQCHQQSYDAGWWHCNNTGIPFLSNNDPEETNHLSAETLDFRSSMFPFVVATKLALVVSETIEALEGHRKNLQDDKLPNRPMIEVELADAMIRILDLAGALNLDLGGAMEAKLSFNQTRPDHKQINRRKPGGKAY